MRFHAMKRLIRFLIESNIEIGTVAVVGGSSNDPEVSALKNIYPSANFSYFGVDNSFSDEHFYFMNLNEFIEEENRNFDLVICSQVLEHVWNASAFFENLLRLAGENGLLWINCPASNMPHGSPDYYAAGYSPNYLSENLNFRGHEILISECIGSKRAYFMTHILRHWPSPADLLHPVRNFRPQPGTFLGKFRQIIEVLPGRFISILFSARTSTTIDFATESYSLSRAKDTLH